MNRSKFSFPSQWRCLMTLVFLGILVGCNQSDYQPDPNKAQIVVTTVVGIGNNDEVFEYRCGETVATANIHYVYNPPTDYEAYSGNLSPIYQAITGKTLDDPSEIQNLGPILSLMKQKGWKIVEDIEEKSHSGGPLKIVRTIRFQRPAN